MATEPREQAGIDNPIERLELLSGDDEAVGRYLDELEVTSPREREMLRELARTQSLDDPAAFFPGITLTVGAWLIVPAVVALAFAL